LFAQLGHPLYAIQNKSYIFVVWILSRIPHFVFRMLWLCGKYSKI